MIQFILTYGYLAVFLVSIFEGESMLILGGFAVYEGYLSIVPLFIAAFLGAVTGDMAWFLLGRYKGHKLMHKYEWFRKYIGKPLKVIHAKPEVTAFALRFMYGFRHVIPFGLGMSSLPLKKFIFWNFLAAIVWVLVIGGAGYMFGDLLEEMLGKVKRYEFGIVATAIVIIGGINILGKTGSFLLRRYLDQKENDSKKC